MGRVMTSGSLGGIIVSTLARIARDVGSILGAIFPIFITPHNTTLSINLIDGDSDVGFLLCQFSGDLAGVQYETCRRSIAVFQTRLLFAQQLPVLIHRLLLPLLCKALAYRIDLYNLVFLFRFQRKDNCTP